VIDPPALAPLQHVDAAIAIADTGCGDVADAHLERILVLSCTGIAIARPPDPNHLAGAPFADLEADTQKLHELAFLGRL